MEKAIVIVVMIIIALNLTGTVQYTDGTTESRKVYEWIRMEVTSND